MHANAKQRYELLGFLYAARELKPSNGWVSEYDIKNALGDAAFAIAVLQETGHIKSDGPRHRITGDGVLAYENMPL